MRTIAGGRTAYEEGRELELGRIGVWLGALARQGAAAEREAVAEIEELGYAAAWYPEGVGGKETFSHGALLLAATRRLVVATGIANIFARDPMAMKAGQYLLCDAYPGRFLLALGVSHKPSVAERGGAYARPLQSMADYLDAMDAAPYGPPQPAEAPRLIGALHPRMLELAARRTLGAHPYFVPVEHTADARARLGAAAVLAPEQAVVLETEPGRARALARQHTAYYLQLDNYRRNLLRLPLGLADADLEGGGSDRLVDAVVAWGDAAAIRARVKEHLDAGATHVSVQALAPAGASPLPILRELAPALLGL